MKIFSTCHHLVHDVPRLTYNDNDANQEGVDSAVSFDHSYDCLRYLLERRKTKSCRVRLPGL
jgi:hypothetical protein